MTATTLTLTKHHGLGNDFLVVFDPAVVDLAGLARAVCDRRRGIGADGLLVGTVDPGGTVRMVLHNADGSRAEMSGNGVRCFAQANAMRRGAVSPQRILTDAGERLVEVWPGRHDREIVASVDMGPVEVIAAPGEWHRIGAADMRPVSHLSLGNPHTVVGVDDVRVVDLLAIGAIVPDVNLEIVEPGPEAGAITMRVHERGAGITEACGTGACASAWAAVDWGLVPATAAEIVVHMDGGDARVRLHQPVRGHVTLVGPAEFVGTVEWPLASPVK
jgi:diaminopimelate epimerase